MAKPKDRRRVDELHQKMLEMAGRSRELNRPELARMPGCLRYRKRARYYASAPGIQGAKHWLLFLAAFSAGLVNCMEKQIDFTEVQGKYQQILDDVQHRGDTYIINRQGQAAVAVVPLAIYENWKQGQQVRRHLVDLIHEVQDVNAAADPEEVMQDVLHAQRATRG